MSKKRMFSLDIIDTDAFMDMPQTSRLLYYELCMRADDDGFVGSPKKILKMVGCNEDDFRILVTKQFIIPFNTGIVVITHWKIHNYIAKDRYKETIYTEEKAQLQLEENGMYTKCIQDVSNLDTQYSIDKYSIVKDSIDIMSSSSEKSNSSSKEISKKDENLILKENIKCIIDYLNDSIGTKYKYNTKGTIRLIEARFKEGYVLDDFYDVIDKKVKEWINDSQMCKYLRPETLFGNKFESYLNGKVFSGKPKSSYSSKPDIDNTRENGIKIHHISDEEFDKLTHEQKLIEMKKFSAMADMTEKQKEFYNNYCLARDENGNLYAF